MVISCSLVGALVYTLITCTSGVGVDSFVASRQTSIGATLNDVSLNSSFFKVRGKHLL